MTADTQALIAHVREKVTRLEDLHFHVIFLRGECAAETEYNKHLSELLTAAPALADRFSQALADLARSNAETEQLRVQLAGCGVAALGGTDQRTQVANKGDYGWSPAYADTLALRLKYEAAEAALATAHASGYAEGREAAAKVAEQPVEYGGDRKHQPEIGLMEEHGSNIAAAIRALTPESNPAETKEESKLSRAIKEARGGEAPPSRGYFR